MRKRWLIAWVHNGNAGGLKRFAFETVRNLPLRGHTIVHGNNVPLSA